MSNCKNIKRVLVTGGAGFIGSHIVDAYIKAGLEVVIVDNFSQGNKKNINKKAKVYKADICDLQSLKKIMKTEQPQLINHHAAHVDVRRSQKNPIFDANQNIIGLLSMLQATENTSLKKIIFASSGGAIYGEQPIPTHERSLTTPTSPYGVSKRAGELYIQSYSRYFNIPYVSLRYGNVYGVRQNHKTNSGIIGMIIESQIQNKSISIYGDGSQTRDYIHVEDVVRANIQASNTVFNGEVNIGTGIQTSITKLIDIISKIMHQKPNVLYLPKKKEEQHDCKLSTALAYKKINWKANISIYEGIKKTIKKYDL